MSRPVIASLLALSLPVVSAAAQPATRPGSSRYSAEIDAQVWKPIAASVANHDIAAMSRAYHPGAVLVTNAGTRLVASALEGWGKDMVTMRKAGTKASVELRFDRRQDDSTTAFEAGAFKYSTTDQAGKTESRYTRMEALLTNEGGRWRTLMERQLEPITEAEWNRLPR